MLEFQVVPEKSLINEDLQLILGMSLNQIIQSLQRQFEIIHGIEMSYSDKHPLTGDITLNLRRDGIRLVFDPMTQRLKLIEITDLSKVRLTYSNIVFCAKDVLPTREQIDETFGATHPGEYDADDQMFHLKFRGLCFSFANSPCDTESTVNANRNWNTGTRTSLVSKMAIYTGTCHKDTTTPPLPMSSVGNSVFLKNLNVLRDTGSTRNKGRTKGVEVQLVCRTRTSVERSNILVEQPLTRTILFGDTVSDVVSAVGSPSKIFYKEEDKMRIHAPNVEEGDDGRSDYFYNYFTLGLDVLFDAKRHTAKKIILHTNFPGDYDFNCYHRCNFCMVLPSLEKDRESLTVTTFSKWNDIAARLVPQEEKPVLLPRGSQNPFQGTNCYGCCGDIIIEVLGTNNFIASVTLFDSTFPS